MIRFSLLSKTGLQLSALLLMGVFASHANAYDADGVQIATGNSHSCMVTQDHQVACWGDNSYGKLGRTNNSRLKEIVPGLTDVEAVAVGDNHSCALLMYRMGVKCWGANNEGQLGNGTIVNSTTPVMVQGSGGAYDLVVGAAHSCVDVGSVVLCWGRNTAGQIGQGTKTPYVNTALAVKATSTKYFNQFSTGSGILAGANHTCVGRDKKIYCWGANGSGQLGTYGTEDQVFPVVANMPSYWSGWMDFGSGGNAHTCITAQGDLYCWGNWGGTTSPRPTYMNDYFPGSYDGVTGLTSGKNHVCVTFGVDAARTVECFGQNLDAQLGNGTVTSFEESPVPVVGLNSPVVGISAGGSSSCAMLANGSIACWGLNGVGQLGDGTGRRALTPVSAGWWVPFAPTLGVTAVGVGYSHTCALKNNLVKCWGNNINGQVGNGVAIGAIQTTPTLVGGLSGNIVSLVSGNLHNCVLLDTGVVKCWGGNTEGQLGDGNIATAQATPVTVAGLNQAATAIMAAGDFTCAALADKTAKCWGSNSHGQLGAGLLISNSPTPLTVFDLFNVTALSGKMVHACALLADKSTKCWGGNFNGQLGDGTTINRNIPVANTAPWMKDITSVSAGTDNTCVLRQGGVMWCWGAITGNGTAGVNTSPIDVSSLYNVAAISSGSANSCAVLANGAVKCFGANATFLGDGTAMPSAGSSYFPSAVRWLAAPASSIVHGRNNSACAILVTGQLSCWGSNGFGMLGDGTSTTKQEPVLVKSL